MGYLITQIIICLLIAFLLGLLIGWWLNKFCCQRQLSTLDEEYKLNLGKVESDRNSYRAKCDELKTSLSEWEQNSGSGAPVQAVSLMSSGGEGYGWPYPVEEVEGIGPTYGGRLRAIGIETTEDLLEKCCEARQQIEVSSHVKVEPFVVGKWVSMCDLMRIPGIRGQFAELVEAAGIASVGELARQQGVSLAMLLERVNAEEHRTPTVPDTSAVNGWIENAKGLATRIKSLAPK